MSLIFSYSPSLKQIRLFARNDYNNEAKEKMEDNILAHKNDEIIIELDGDSESFLKTIIEGD
jgi:uncharacterized membrane protein